MVFNFPLNLVPILQISGNLFIQTCLARTHGPTRPAAGAAISTTQTKTVPAIGNAGNKPPPFLSLNIQFSLFASATFPRKTGSYSQGGVQALLAAIELQKNLNFGC